MIKKNIKLLHIEYPYSHSVILRRSAFTKSAWETLVHKFGISCAESKDVLSITIDGEDDFGHLLLSICVEEDAKEEQNHDDNK